MVEAVTWSARRVYLAVALRAEEWIGLSSSMFEAASCRARPPERVTGGSRQTQFVSEHEAGATHWFLLLPS
jgi:hypothetical protein